MKYKLSDEVSFRMIQIFQEAILLGIDGADLFREVRLVVDPSDENSNMLVLDSEYIEHVNKMHEDLVDEISAKINRDAKEKSD
jgi:hypothetical protein